MMIEHTMIIQLVGFHHYQYYVNMNGNFRILKRRYCTYKAIFCGDIPFHRPYIDLIYGRYLQCRFLKWPLII